MSTAIPGNRHRPMVVTVAVVIQVIIAVLTIVTAIVQSMYASDVAEAVRAELERQGVAPASIDQYAGSGDSTITVAIGVVVGVAYLVLAYFNARGSQGSRITTWVLSGIFLLCNLIIVGIAGLGGGAVEGIDLDAMVAAATDAVPGWYNALTSASSIVTLVGYFAVIILLALPAAHPFFRKQEPPVMLPPEAMNS